MTATLAKLKAKVRDAEEALHAEFVRQFPVGSKVEWVWNGHFQVGWVVATCAYSWVDPYMTVENARTGKRTSITLSTNKPVPSNHRYEREEAEAA